MARLADLIRNPFSFLFQRSSQEERLAAYVIREHDRGRSLEEECDRDPLECLVGTWTATSFTTTILNVRSGGDGLLGRDFLDRFTVNIDNNAGVVTLTPRTAPAR